MLRRKVPTAYSMTSIFIYLCNMLISRSYTVRKVLTDFAVLYLTDDAIAQLNICDLKFRQIEGNDRKFPHIALSNSIIS